MEPALTPQNGTEAVPAWGPPSEIKFLTCYRHTYTCKHSKGLVNGSNNDDRFRGAIPNDDMTWDDLNLVWSII